MKVDQDLNFLNYVVFLDEATFYLNGHVNSQNHRYWNDKNPHLFIETHTQTPQKVNVWCGIVGQHLIGPFFIEGNLNGEAYLNLLQNEIVPAIQHLFPGDEFERVHFQQDGAPAHFSRIAREYLDVTFPNRWIGRGVGDLDLKYPPRSPDLTPLDFFLWGYLKDRVFKNKPQDLKSTKDEHCK